MNLFFSLLAGVIFGIGLLVSGMANPARVIGFLDMTRVWDPSLAFVMGGAISVGFFAFRSVKHRTHSLCGGTINLPTSKQIDKRLIGGAILFGIGWAGWHLPWPWTGITRRRGGQRSYLCWRNDRWHADF
jgi:uncharacterized membrane protein YedE/YeeE